MKKNISINLQGMIFHIEEDGYEQLSQYLTAIKAYFSAYEGHEEIIGDIESRIAEIFYTKLSPTKQVITREDVLALIAQMGSVADFAVLEAEEEKTHTHSQAHSDPFNNPGPGSAAGYGDTQTGSKRIYTDQSRKILGGVAAGIANYLNIDPLWVRLLLAFLVLIAPLTAGLSVAFVLIAYVLCWLAFPKSYSLPETNSKKLFRNPTDKKLGGVASGMAYFFGMDVAVIRLLFLISVFLGGFGFIIYIVLWIIVPEASSITDRVQMQGNPVTLSSIEESLKNNLRMKDENGRESTLATVILFPVRLISQVLQFLARVLNPLLSFLVAAIRIFAGVLLMAAATATIFGLFILAIMGLSLVDGSTYIEMPGDVPLSMFVESFPVYGLIAGFFAILIPALFILLVGLALLLKRFYLRSAVGWSLFGIWILAIFVVTLAGIDFASEFREEGSYTREVTFPTAAYETVTLKSRHQDNNWDNTHLEFQTYAGSDIRLVQTFEAQGPTEAEAIRHAGMITYRVVQQDSVLTFDDSFKYKPNAIFRDQSLYLKLLIPENKKLRISGNLAWRLGDAFNRHYDHDYIERHVWQARKNKLECLDCPPEDTLASISSPEPNDLSDVNDLTVQGLLLEDEDDYGDENRTFNQNQFDRVEVSGAYHVRIRQGSEYAISARGEEKQLRNLEIKRSGNTLVVRPRRSMLNFGFRNEGAVLVTIQMPQLTGLDFSGAVRAEVKGFETNDLDFSASGAVQSLLAVNSRNLRIDNSGACLTTVTGSGESLRIEGSGACQIQADGFKAARAEIDVSGASQARVFVTDRLQGEVSGGSHLVYRGNPRYISIDESGAGSADREK